MKEKKRGFTIFEVIFMVIVIAVGIVTIITVLNNGFTFLQKTRERTIAINLAREGMEAVYQMRDTNRYRRAGDKEKNRLKVNPLISGNAWISTGYYILTTSSTGGQEYFLLSGTTSTGGINLDDGIQTGDRNFSLCEQTDNSWKACPGSTPTSKEGTFLRQIYGIGLFLKDSMTTGGTQILCTSGSNAPCNDGSAKEFRFCSEVHYIGKGQGRVQLCGMLTNFQKK